MTSPARAGDRRLTEGKSIDQWATDVLSGLGVPITHANVDALVTWANVESGGYNPSVKGGLNNPLNTTEGALCRSYNWPASGSCRNGGSQGNIKDFSTYGLGVASIVHNLRTPAFGYPAIVAALRKGNDPQAVFAAVDASQFGTHLRGVKVQTSGGNTGVLTDIHAGPITIPAPGPNIGVPNPLDAAQALGSLAQHLTDAAFWKRVGTFVLGAWVFLAGLYIVFKDTAPGQAVLAPAAAARTMAKDAAKAAATAAVVA